MPCSNSVSHVSPWQFRSCRKAWCGACKQTFSDSLPEPCAVSGCAPTAQAANQQGKYLGKLFQNTNLDETLINQYPQFVFSYKGALAYVGSSRGIAELKNLWDVYPVNGQVKVEGTSAFAIWRSLYFSSLLSSRNQAQVAFDWIKGYIFGRDISTPAGKTTQQRD